MSNIIIHERPGVYSSYDTSTVIRGGRAVRVIGVAAKATAGAPNVPVTLTSYEGGLSAFGEDAEGTPGMSTILSLLFENGASTVVAVSVEEDDYASAFAALKAMDNIQIVVCDSGDEALLVDRGDGLVRAFPDKRGRILAAVVCKAELARGQRHALLEAVGLNDPLRLPLGKGSRRRKNNSGADQRERQQANRPRTA